MSGNILVLQKDINDKLMDKTMNISTNISINGKIYNLEKFYNSYSHKNNAYIIITFSNIIKYLKTINVKFYLNNNNINNEDDYFFFFNGKLISSDIKFKYVFENCNDTRNANYNHNIHNIDIIDIIQKQKGGGSIIDAFMSIIKIGELFLKLGDIILWLLKFIAWFIQFLIWLMFDLLNPLNFATDFFKSLLLITVSICRIPLDLVLTLYKLGINTIAGWMQGFWGWDMSNLSKADKNSPYFQRINKNKGQKVYYTNSNTVPFSIILGTILCPPMGVFMDLGTSGWINIIICALLTLLFYIPGLCYALLIIYS